MAENTTIEWCDSSWNPWIGCTKVGPGCDHCYAEADFDLRKHRVKWGPGNARSRTSPANWKKPIQWNQQPFSECMKCGWRGELRHSPVVKNPDGFYPPADAACVCPSCRHPMLKAARRRVFCASLADVFDNEVDPAWRAELFVVIACTLNLDWLLLTKRIGNVAKMIEAPGMQKCGLPPNVWLGASICNQEEADRDIPKLLAVPAAVRWISAEPLLGPLNLRHLNKDHETNEIDALQPWTWEQEIENWRGTSETWEDDFEDWYNGLTVANAKGPCHNKIDWVVVGGESGANARPMQADWARSLRDQCAAAGVAFLFKQWGEWAPAIDAPYEMQKWGKRAAGRTLDGVIHDCYPGGRP